MPWQLSCHGMCKIVTWSDHHFSDKKKTNFSLNEPLDSNTQGLGMISKQLSKAEKFKTVDGNGVVVWKRKIMIDMEQTSILFPNKILYGIFFTCDCNNDRNELWTTFPK